MKIYTKRGGEITVFTALLANGDGNAKELPKEVYEIYDGLGRGTKTVKTYFAIVEADTQVTVELPNVKSVKVKPEIDFTFENGIFTFDSKQNLNFKYELKSAEFHG